MQQKQGNVVIVDYGLGNVFSILRACEHVGLMGTLSNAKTDIENADAVILPGVGAFGNAMETLRRLDLVQVLKDAAVSGKPFMGICLGLQLLMTESHEFGRHKGLGLIEGDVVKIEPGAHKVPQVGWNSISRPAGRTWEGTGLEGTPEGTSFYFVHSYHVRPTAPSAALSQTTYGPVTFCSSVQVGKVFACQFHPERSGPAGLKLYENFKNQIFATREVVIK